MHLKIGDEVVVTAGNHKGQRGKVTHLLKAEDRVIVEGVNLREKHLPRTQANPQGGTVEREFPLHASNVLVWSDKANKGVRTKVVDEKGKKVRVGIPCGTKFD